MVKILKDKELITQRLTLEPLVEEHAALLFEILRDKKIYRFISEKPPADVSQLKKRYQLLEERTSMDGKEIWLNWAVKINKNNQYIGTTQATIYGDNTANIAYVFSPKFWKKGFAFESCMEMMGFLFTEYRICKAIASVDTRNDNSKKLLWKLGFSEMPLKENSEDNFYECEASKFIDHR